MAPPVQPPIPLFPPPATLTFVEDSGLQGAVKAATDKLTSARGGKAPVFRLAIIDLGDESPSSTLKFGAFNGDKIDFIASEAKLIALYAAFALRDMVERFSAALKAAQMEKAVKLQAIGVKVPPAPNLFAALRANMDPAILSAADPRLAHIAQDERLPKYEAVFTVPASGVPHFKGEFLNALFKMIVNSDNNAASTVTMGVGFAYISGAMRAANLLVDGKGPWLSADFANHYHPLMDSANDNMVGQAGTALSMAKLMSIIMTGAVHMGSNAFEGMKMLLHDAVNGPDTPFLTRSAPNFTDPHDTDPTKAPLRIPRDKITHIKLGRDWLKKSNGGFAVGSEVWRLKGLNKADKVYALAFQNLLWHFNSSEDLAWVIWNAIENYEP
jgi:hypothetical protein